MRSRYAAEKQTCAKSAQTCAKLLYNQIFIRIFARFFPRARIFALRQKLRK